MGYATPAYHGRSSEFGTAMRRSAERRRCPKCGRKSALVDFREDLGDALILGSGCRWCDYRTSFEVKR